MTLKCKMDGHLQEQALCKPESTLIGLNRRDSLWQRAVNTKA
ncbi:hypothetical protein JCM19240_2221 [Vibrio maritimus]|uniref:Uncharacterized protein n=1 Tax=Vibrio maritimus TaxID=990268 RepID=A0A090T0K1_9VIBR|nr:hypothetical protein JCM19240_2221 [Vibrio maritimus]